MKFGVNTLIWTAHFDREHLPLLEEIAARGFDTVELARFNWDAWPAADIRRAAEASRLGITICTVLPGLSLIHEDAAERAKAIEYVKRSLHACAEVGGTCVAGPIYSPVGYLPGRRRTEEEWKRQIDSLQQIAPTLDETGVDLAVEPLNRFETFFLNTAADGARLCAEVGHKRVGLLYDTFHANIEEKSQAEALRAAAPHLLHMHTCENDRGAPGTGHVEWNDVFATLKAIGYGRTCVIESFGFTIKELAAATCIWRDLAPTPAQIAWDGLPFLKEALKRA